MILETTRIQARPQYRHESDMFLAARGGGGGYIKFIDGQYHSWFWCMKFAVCKHCGAPVGMKKSNLTSDGLIRNAKYFVCEGKDHHIIIRTDDLKWGVNAVAREEAWRAKGKVDDVKAVYDWLNAVPDEDEGIPI